MNEGPGAGRWQLLPQLGDTSLAHCLSAWAAHWNHLGLPGKCSCLVSSAIDLGCCCLGAGVLQNSQVMLRSFEGH